MLQEEKFLPAVPDEYYRTTVPKVALDYVQRMQPDIIVLPFQIHEKFQIVRQI